jgi:hypothetical protein
MPVSFFVDYDVDWPAARQGRHRQLEIIEAGGAARSLRIP